MYMHIPSLQKIEFTIKAYSHMNNTVYRVPSCCVIDENSSAVIGT